MSNHQIEPTSIIVLAGERPGGNSLAQAKGTLSALTVNLNGRAVIDWTLDTLLRTPLINQIELVGPSPELCRSESVFQRWVAHSRLRWHEPSTGPAASILKVAEKLNRWPLLVTTADHALLQPEDVLNFIEVANKAHGEFIVGIVPYARVLERYPESRRTVIGFQGAGYCGSNLFWIKSPEGLAAVKFWQQLEQYRKKPWKLARKLGFPVLIRYLLGRLSRVEALARLSALSGVKVAAVDLLSAHLAIDVDSIDDLELAEKILAHRGGVN